MRKVLVLVIGICLIGIMGFVVVGCSQQAPTIGTSQPSGLKIKGVIYTTTLSGTIGAPISGASVAISGDSANFTSVTNSNGEYVISGIPDGSYLLTVTAEGHKRSTGNSVTIKPSEGVPADNTITVSDIQLSSNPIILDYSPVPNSVISQTPTFVVTFNEAMDVSTIIPSLSPSGIRTYASGDTIPLATTLVDGKTLIITPEATLISNQTYVLYISPSTTIRDIAGYSLATLGDQALAPYRTYRISAGGVPAAPSNIIVTTAGGRIFTTTEATTGADYSHVYMGNLNLYWAPPSSGGLVTGYKVYAAIDTASAGNYVLVGTVIANNTAISLQTLINALFGANSTVNPVSTMNYPLINKTLYFKVIAYNGDGESGAASWSGKETVGPQVDATAFDGRATKGKAAKVLNNNYYLPALTAGTDTKIAYIAFNQPVDAATVTATNFSLSAGTVTGAALLTSRSTNLTASFTGSVYSIVRITSDTAFGGGETLTVGTGVKDLAGNPVVLGTGDTVTLP